MYYYYYYKYKGVVVVSWLMGWKAREVPVNLQNIAEVPLSKVPNPKMLK